MPQIGEFTRGKSGFTGRIRTIALDVELAIVPSEPSDAENMPDYRVRIGDEDGPEAGVGWKRTGERAGEYIALLIDDPTLPQPVNGGVKPGHWAEQNPASTAGTQASAGRA